MLPIKNGSTEFEKYRELRDSEDADDTKFRTISAERLTRLLSMGKLDILEGRKVEEIFKTESSTKEFISGLSIEKYSDLLTGINAMLRNKGKDKKWEMDGERVRMGKQDIFPRQSDKEPLLAKSLEAAREMISKGRPMEDIAILLSSSITSIHPFVDGNGRTAKFVLVLVNCGYNSDLISDVLSRDTDDFSQAVNGEFFGNVALNVIEREFVPTEKYKTFDEFNPRAIEETPEDETYKDYNKRNVEVVIDMILNNDKPQYKGFSWMYANYAAETEVVHDDESSLDYFKRLVQEKGDKELSKKVFVDGRRKSE